MADTVLTRDGYGQVEPNHLSGQRTGQIYAQLPAKSDITALQNGMFVKYDYANGVCNFTGDGEWMLVFNEVKLYNEQAQLTKDFALKKADATDGVMVPRVYKTNIGDIFTTNMLNDDVLAGVAVGDDLVVGTDGVLDDQGTPVAGEMLWKVVKITTMPDGQGAVKLQRIQ